MALSGVHTGTAVGGFSLQINWSATQNISNNTSTITAKAYVVIASGWSINIGSRTGVITIDGTDTNITYNLGLKSSGTHYIGTASKTITHNTDGTKSFAISGNAKIEATISGYGWIGTLYKGSNTYTLNTIPRYAKITSWGMSGVQLDRFTISRSADKAISETQYRLNGGTWYALPTNGVITGRTPGTTYRVQIRVKASDSGLWTNSGEQSVTTVRLSTATIGNKYLDETIPVTVSRANSNITHTVKLYALADNQTNRLITTKTGVTTSVNITLTEAEKDSVLSNRTTTKNTTYYVSVESHWSGSQGTVNSNEATMTFRNINPTVGTLTYKDVNALALSLTNNNQHLVQSKSDLRLTVSNVTAKLFSKIKRVTVTIGNSTRSVSYNSTSTGEIVFSFDKLNVDNTSYAYVSVTDSRGFTANKNITVLVFPYHRPNFVLYKASRLNGFEDESYLDYKIRYSEIVRHSLSAKYWIKPTYDSGYENSVDTTVPTEHIIENGERFAVLNNELMGEYSNDEVWNIKIEFTDHFGTYFQELALGKASGLAEINRGGLEFKERIKGVSASGHISPIATIKDIQDMLK